MDQRFFESKLPAYEFILAFPGMREFWGSEMSSFDPRFKAYVEAEVLAGQA